MASEKQIKILKKEFKDPADGAKFAGKYLLRQWRWGQKNIAVSKATKIDLMSQLSTIDPGIYQLETLAQTLVSAPFDHTPASPNYNMLNDLPGWLGDLLVSEAREINREMTVARQKNS